MNKSVDNKIVLVTGGASGIGLAIVDKFLEHHAKVVVVVDINDELGGKAIKKMTEKYGIGKTEFYKCDVTTDLEKVFENIAERFKIDILVNNAGTVNEKSIEKTININVTALMEWTNKFYDYMRKDKNGNGGTIINIASVYGIKTTPFLPAYHASKSAVIGFTKSLGHEYNFKRTGVRVIVVCPDFTYTELTADLKPREEYMVEDFKKEQKKCEWQDVDVVGRGIIEVVNIGESGSVWVISGSRPPTLL